MKYSIYTYIALFLYYIGIKWSWSTFIDEDSITMGYGKLDYIGNFKLPLPSKIIKKKFKGCTKYSQLTYKL